MNELSPLPVPEPIFADVEAGVLAYFKLPGVPLFDHAVADPAGWRPPWAGSWAVCTGLPCRKWRSWWEGTPIR